MNHKEPARWKDIAQDWETVPLAAYEFLFSQAQDRFHDSLSESESITDKSIGFIKLAGIFVSAFVAFNFRSKPNIWWLLSIGACYLITFLGLLVLMFPKGIIFKGSPPEEIFCSFLDNPNYIDDEKTKILYYHELRRYQARIEVMNKKNRRRHFWYAVVLITLLCAVVLTAGVIAQTII